MNVIMQNDMRSLFPQQQQLQDQDGLSPNFFMNNAQQSNMMRSQKITPRFQSMGQDMLGGGQQGQQIMNMNNFQAQPLPLNMDSSLNNCGVSMDDKRKLLMQEDCHKPVKKQRTEDPEEEPTTTLVLNMDETNAPAPIPASSEGLSLFEDNDVLSGRGGGTNVHPGNRNFRDLINLHRRSYLKARKNDKPAISRAIVRCIRETGGRFLKKDEKGGLWYEIGDDAAREKTSQALRQRAPEMRKLLFDTEREEARAAAEEHLLQQRMLMGGMNQNVMGQNMGMGQGMNSMNGMNNTNDSQSNGMMNPALFQAMNNKLGGSQQNSDFSQMFSAALLQGGINRFTPNGA